MDPYHFYFDPTILEGKFVVEEDMPSQILHLLEIQGWLPFLRVKAPVFPNLVRQFYATLEQVNLTKKPIARSKGVRSEKATPSLLPVNLLVATVADTPISVPLSLFSELFTLSNTGVKICIKTSWNEETDYFSIAKCLRFLNRIPEEEFTNYDEYLPTPSLQNLSAHNAILLRILRENIIPEIEGVSIVSNLECMLLYLLNKEIPIALPHLILQHMIESKNSPVKPYGMILTHVFKHGHIPVPNLAPAPGLLDYTYLYWNGFVRYHGRYFTQLEWQNYIRSMRRRHYLRPIGR